MVSASGFGNEKIVYYGCVFQEKEKTDRYWRFLPQVYETPFDREAGRLMLHSAENKALNVGDRVDMGPYRSASGFTDDRLAQLNPVGK